MSQPKPMRENMPELTPPPEPAPIPHPTETVAIVRKKTGSLDYSTYPAAGFRVRLAASIVDGAFTAVLGKLAILPFKGMLLTDEWSSLATVLFQLELGIVINILYCVFPLTLYGRTIGKRCLGLRVISTKGGDLSVGQACVRELLGKTLSSLFLMAGFLVALGNDERRTFHDWLASTRVVRDTEQES